MVTACGKVTFLGFFVWFTVSKSPVCRVEVAGLPCQSRRFTLSKLPPVCHVEITGLPYQSRRFVVSKSLVYRVKVAGLSCQSHRFTVSKSPPVFAVSKSPVYRFTVSKSPVCRFEVAESPVCRVEVTGENEIKSDENKKKHLQIRSKIKIKKAYVYKSYLCYIMHVLIKTFVFLISVKF